MKYRRVHNRLLELMQERERKINRRVKQHDIAQFIGVADHTIIKWVRNEVNRFESEIISGICEYFDCELSDLLVFEWVDVPDEELD